MVAPHLDPGGAHRLYVMAFLVRAPLEVGGVHQPVPSANGERHHHVELAVRGVGLRRQGSTASDVGAVAHADLEHPSPPVREHGSVRRHPEPLAPRRETGDERTDGVPEPAQPGLVRLGFPPGVGADPAVHRVDHDPTRVIRE